MQKLITDQREENKCHGVLRQKWGICICPPTPKAKDHCRRGSRKTVRARGQGGPKGNCLPDMARLLYSWTHTSCDDLQGRVNTPSSWRAIVDLWLLGEGKSVSFKGVVPHRFTTLQCMSVWAVQIGLGRLLFFFSNEVVKLARGMERWIWEELGLGRSRREY